MILRAVIIMSKESTQARYITVKEGGPIIRMQILVVNSKRQEKSALTNYVCIEVTTVTSAEPTYARRLHGKNA